MGIKGPKSRPRRSLSWQLLLPAFVLIYYITADYLRITNLERDLHSTKAGIGKLPATLSGPFAYAFYAASTPYYCSALVNVYQLQKLVKDPSIDIIIIIPDGFTPPAEMKAKADVMGVIHHNVPTVPAGTYSDELDGLIEYYGASFNKLHIFTLTKYSKIVFIDADSLILRPMDDLFMLPSADIAAPRAYWIDPGQMEDYGCNNKTANVEDGPLVGIQQKFTTALMVVEPSQKIWSRLQNKYWPNGKANFSDLFDMDMLNIEFKDEVMLLPGSLLRLTSDWGPEGRIRHRNVPGNEEALDDKVWQLTRVLHMTWPGKMWTYPPDMIRKKVKRKIHQYTYLAWDTWWKVGSENVGCVALLADEIEDLRSEDSGSDQQNERDEIDLDDPQLEEQAKMRMKGEEMTLADLQDDEDEEMID